MLQRGRTHSARAETRPRGRAKKREGVRCNRAAHTQTQVGKERGDEAVQ